MEKRAFAGDHAEFAGTVFTTVGKLHFAAELMRHQLHAVADPQNRKTEVKNRPIGMRGVARINAGRPSAENDSLRPARSDFVGRNIESDNLRINLTFAHPARDHLRVLRPEVENQDLRLRSARHASSPRATVRE